MLCAPISRCRRRCPIPDAPTSSRASTICRARMVPVPGQPIRAKPASRLAEVDVPKVGRGASAPPFIVMDVIAAANARQAALPPEAPHVIRMEVGQPGTGAPAGAIAAAAAALRSGDALGYTEAFG